MLKSKTCGVQFCLNCKNMSDHMMAVVCRKQMKLYRKYFIVSFSVIAQYFEHAFMIWRKNILI